MQISGAALSELFRGVDLVGVLANALLGGAKARSERLDPVGFVTLAILSGVGGGLIRDTLLQRGAPVALIDDAYVLTAIAGAAIAFAVRLEGRWWDLAFPFVDAAALGCWAASGSEKTLALGFGSLAAVLLGTVTAVGGGMARDVVLRRIPTVFGGNTLYASAAAIASGVMVAFHRFGRPSIGLVAATVTGASVCLVARWRGWRLPDASDDARSRRGRSGVARWRPGVDEASAASKEQP